MLVSLVKKINTKPLLIAAGIHLSEKYKTFAKYFLHSVKFPVVEVLPSAHPCALEADGRHHPAKTNATGLHHPHAAPRDLTVGSRGGKGALKSTCCHA